MKIKNTILTLMLGAGSALVVSACDAPSTDFDRDEPAGYEYDDRKVDDVEVDDNAIIAPGDQDRYGTDDGFDLNADDPRDDGLADPQDDGMIDGYQEHDLGQGNER